MGTTAAGSGRWRKRVGWLWWVRWLVAAATGLLGGIAASRELPVASGLFGLALSWSLLNLAIALLERRLGPRSVRRTRRVIAAQLLLDAVLLAGLVHGTGGIASPFSLFLLPLVCAAVAQLSSKRALVVSAVAALTGGLALFGPPASSALRLAPGVAWIGGLGAGGLAAALCWTEGARRRRRPARRLRRRPGSRDLVESLATDVAMHVRDPLGSVRARAELLRLSGLARPTRSRRDLRLLLVGLEGIERALRGILAFLPPSRVGSRIDLKRLVDEEWARDRDPRLRLVPAAASRELRGSHAELSLAVELLLRLAREQADPADAVRVSLRVAAAGGEGVLELSFRARSPSDWSEAGSPSSRAQAAGIALPLTLIERVAVNHGGRLDLSVHDPRVRLSLFLQGFMEAGAAALATPGGRAE